MPPTHPFGGFSLAGFITAIWDSNFDTATTFRCFKKLARRSALSWRSLSDEYHWSSNKRDQHLDMGYSFALCSRGNEYRLTGIHYRQYGVARRQKLLLGSLLECEQTIMVSDTGRSAMNATAPGKRIRTQTNDGYTYAQRAGIYFQQMKAADPTIQNRNCSRPGEELRQAIRLTRLQLAQRQLH